MRVLVLGSAGFIGRRVVAALAAESWAEPIAAIHHHQAATAPRVRTLQVDSTRPESVTAALSQVDAVVNCVVGNGATITTGTQVLLDCALAQPRPPAIVHLSTMSVYGSATGVVNETADLRDDLGWYGAAKIDAERRVRDYAAGGAPAVILRPGCVYGPGSRQWTRNIASLLAQGRLGDLGAAGDGHCNLVYVDDVAQAVVRALQTTAASGQTFNLADPQARTWNWYFTAFAQELGLSPVARISGGRIRFEGRVLAPFLKVMQILCGRLRLASPKFPPEPIAPSMIRLFRHDIVLDSAKAERILGLRWTPITQGLQLAAAGIVPR
jgi:nucleoside-diphosphate-sugar epimerase